MPSGTPAQVTERVAQGDRDYTQAMAHLRNSDPSVNPDWAEENQKALVLFKKANDESYVPAMEECGTSVPQALLERVREATLRASFCRKRAVGVRK